MNTFADRVRTLLVLGRVSNLPTVWSNLFIGWCLAGGFFPPVAYSPLILALFSGSLLYIGGMYLNDFCDADFDTRHCQSRPIPAGKISRSTVAAFAGLWFTAGIICIIPFGWNSIGISIGLILLIILYDFHHKSVWWAPLVMGLCRFTLYPLGASVGDAVPGAACLWGAMVGLYVAGITYVAKAESRPDKPARSALLLLLPPILFAGLLYWTWPAWLLFCLLPLGWMTWLFIPLWLGTNRSIGRVVSGLLAGIILIDLLMAAPMATNIPVIGVAYVALFAFALLLQRVIPAT